MVKRLDIHEYDARLRQAIKHVSAFKITKKNYETVMLFKDYLIANGIGAPRVIRYMQLLPRIAQWLDKNFEEATKEDILRVVSSIESADYTKWTKTTYKSALRRFYKWLLGEDEEYPAIVKWVKSINGNGTHKLPEELLTEKDVEAIINACSLYRDKALISVLYESGCRVGEIGNLRVKHVSFDEYGAVLNVDGKTGSRRVRVIKSVPHLLLYIKSLGPVDPDGPLWLTSRGNMLDYASIRKMLREKAELAGIKKRVNPHAFRHSRATNLANVLTEAQMKEYLGWVQSSKMASVYIHLSGRDVDNALLKAYGLKAKDNGSDLKENLPVKCTRCNFVNTHDAKFCGNCGMPTDMSSVVQLQKERDNVNKVLNALMSDPEIAKLITEKAKKLNEDEGKT